MTPQERVAHVYELAAKPRVGLHYVTDPSLCGYHEAEHTVCLVLPDTEVGYAVALHELGHVSGPGGMRTTMADRLKLVDASKLRLMSPKEVVAIHFGILRDERGAWAWARSHAREWTPAMQATMVHALRTYTDPLDELKETCPWAFK